MIIWENFHRKHHLRPISNEAQELELFKRAKQDLSPAGVRGQVTDDPQSSVEGMRELWWTRQSGGPFRSVVFH